MPRRCFLAIGLSPGPTRTVRRACRAFADAAPSWAGEKWVRAKALHITLRFIGALPDAAMPETVSAVAAACAVHPGHRLVLRGVRAVPSMARATMLWATYSGDVDTCAGLARDIDVALEGVAGLAPDARTFLPHSTLVRARRHRPAPETALRAASDVLKAGKEPDGVVSVRSVTLYESTLGPDGPHYYVLASFPLAQ